MLQLTDKEVQDLLDYFINRAGYISYEFDMPTHEIIKKLQRREREVIQNDQINLRNKRERV